MYFECDEEDLKPDCSSGHWILQSYWDPSYILQTNILDFPMGTHEWESKEDFALCNRFSGYHKQLTFSQCYPDKFTCGSGHCIDLADRCNSIPDCEDKSDENKCIHLKIDENYAKATLPVSESLDPCMVFINVTIFALPILSTKELRFTADFYLNLRWYDLRLTLLDLNLKNRMSEKDLDSIWMPKILFSNSLGPLKTVGSTVGRIIRENDPMDEDITQSIEGRYYFQK